MEVIYSRINGARARSYNRHTIDHIDHSGALKCIAARKLSPLCRWRQWRRLLFRLGMLWLSGEGRCVRSTMELSG